MELKQTYSSLNSKHLNKYNDGSLRNYQQFKLIEELIKDNDIFKEYPQPSQIIQDISKKIVLIWSQLPQIAQTNQNEIFLILEGKCFQYMKNNQSNIPSKLHQNNQYIMVRKLEPNSFFLVYSLQTKYKNVGKYQLMVDENTLLAKISDEIFMRYFYPLIQSKWSNNALFLRKVKLFAAVPQIVFYELSQYLHQIKINKQTIIIPRGSKSQFVYFIKDGEVEIKKHRQKQPQNTPNANYIISHKNLYLSLKLKKYQFFGMETFEFDSLKDNQSNLQTSVETIQDTTLYRIDKRLLAIVIASFQQQFRRKSKVWSSINMNQQIQGQAYQSPQLKFLIKNAERIRTSDKKIRDIKLRYLQSNKKDRFQIDFKKTPKQQSLFNQDQTKFIPKFRSTSHINRQKHSLGVGINPTPIPASTAHQWMTLFSNQNKISSIVISALQNSSMMEDLYNQTQSKILGLKKAQPSRHFVRNQSTVKFQSEFIKSYLQKRAKDEILSKNQIITSRKQSLKKYQVKSLRRLYSLQSKAKSQSKKQKQLGQELYDRMAKLNEHPLHFKIQSDRKKLENLQSKVIKNMSSKSVKKIKKQDQILLIRQY